MDALTLDQFLVFVTTVEEGSFAAAARRMNRAQSAITYTIQKLEEQSRLPLFDRSAYRPTLTEAGKALLPRARRILDDVADWRHQAQGISKGLEAELTLAVVSYAPPDLLSRVLSAFNAEFPFVSKPSMPRRRRCAMERSIWHCLPNVSRRSSSAVCATDRSGSRRRPKHALGRIKGPFSAARLRDHTQLVISPTPHMDSGREYGVLAANRWRVNDLQTKYDLILAGVGWGSMPRSRVENDLLTGRIVELKPESWEGSDSMPSFPLVVAYRKENALGPAAQWLVKECVAQWELSPVKLERR
ncbi:hypothetical protein AJ87_11100 [Rhizobium yanglingense]|nr:hypothetical protein AJ87_11100 [Rhizobium yanglingense]